MKAFTSAALLAFLATAQEGTAYWGSGVSRYNAKVYNLYTSDTDSTKLDLQYYYVDDDGTDKIHIDLILYFPDADFEPYIDFGYCFAVESSVNKWDCL